VIRKALLLFSAAALAMPLLSGSSPAADAKVDASQYTVHCDTVVGTVGFAPPLSASGPTAPNVIKLKAVLGGCTATPTSGGTPVTILSGNVTGKLTGSSQNCSGLLGPASVAGTIVTTWKTTPSLLVNKSTLTPATIAGGTFTPPAPFTGTYGSFHIGGAGVSVTGAFAGTDGGATSIADATTGEDVTALLGACSTPKGLKTVHLGFGDITLK